MAVLPAEGLHRDLGATFADYGGWRRPACYPRAGENPVDAITREALSVRAGVGLFDASPLGKIEVHGPDAGLFLDRLVVATVSTLAPGRCRYVLMCNDKGIVIDDGIVTRRPDGSFILGTSTAGATRMHAVMEELLQCEWPDLEVAIFDVTQAWAVLSITGPMAPRLFSAIAVGSALAGPGFRHMDFREGALLGLPARVARASFTGEACYEIAVPADSVNRLARELLELGRPLGLCPFGIEALTVLRTEKGFIHIGTDTDGSTMPQDIGFGGPVLRKTSDFIGRRSALLPAAQEARRRQLVGFAIEGDTPLSAGACVRSRSSGRAEGWITSSVLSPTLGRPHALGVLEAGQARMGETVDLVDVGKDNRMRHFRARIVPKCAFDPEGRRLTGEWQADHV